MPPSTATSARTQPSLFGLLARYKLLIGLLVGLTVASNGFSLAVPQIIARAIDTYTGGTFALNTLIIEFSVVAALIFVFTYLQNIVQVYASERVARDLRRDLSAAISMQSSIYVDRVGPSKLLTNLTSDVDAVKDIRLPGHRLAHLVGLSYHRRLGAPALYRLAPRARRARRGARYRRDLLLRARAGAQAVPPLAGGHRLAQLGHQREHPRRPRSSACSTPSSPSIRSSLRPIPRRAPSA